MTTQAQRVCLHCGQPVRQVTLWPGEHPVWRHRYRDDDQHLTRWCRLFEATPAPLAPSLDEWARRLGVEP